MSDYPPPPMHAAGTKAGPLRRLGARMIDGLVMLIPVLVISAVLGESVAVGNAEPDGGAFLASVIGTLITFAYFVVMEASSGGTLGKKALGMSVHDRTGTGAITAEQSAKRNAFVFLGVVPIVGGLLALGAIIAIAVTVNSDPEGRGFHDKWADALVRRNA